MRRGLACGWSWEAYAQSKSWRGFAGDLFNGTYRLQDAVDLTTRVTGTVDFVNVQAATFPSVPWASGFYVAYTGLLKVTMPGTVVIDMASSTGAVGSQCKINGIIVAKTSPSTLSTLTTGTYSGRTVRPLLLSATHHRSCCAAGVVPVSTSTSLLRCCVCCVCCCRFCPLA